MCICIRVETESGHPDHVLPCQAGLTRFIKYPGLTRILHWIMCVDKGIWYCMVLHDHSNELSMLGSGSNERDISAPQD